MAGKKGGDEAGAGKKSSPWLSFTSTTSSRLKRLSYMSKKSSTSNGEKRRVSGGSDFFNQNVTVEIDGEQGTGAVSGTGSSSTRKLFFNLPLPDEYKDEEGHPIQHFPRNKIRTAKYTPLSFVPKNLWFQFHNIANIFFLFLVILVIFPIFGGVNPGLNAVPLIFIITVTAIKDAIEDYRRTILDNELNNAPVHRLCGWHNVNVEADNVSAWRKVKKATSKVMGGLWRWTIGLWKKDAANKRASAAPRAIIDPRISVDTRRTRLESLDVSHLQRQSFMSAREEIQMTQVPRNDKHLEVPDGTGGVTSAPHPRPYPQQNIPGDLINRTLPVSGNARFHRNMWKHLVVGDFVRLYNGDELPADVIVLATSDPDGVCYVETKNLDGETNLKVRSALQCSRTVRHARDCERAQFTIESEAPQPNLYKYSGTIRWQQKAPDDDPFAGGEAREMSEPISIDNMLLRGCSLRNTDWVLAVVAFTGHDTKIMMNAGITPSKRARIAREMNLNVACNFGAMLIMCLIAAIVCGVAWGRTDSSLHFFDYGSIGGSPAMSGFITFWAAVILFQNLVPISLIISLEIVRTLQAVFIYSDVHMYYDKIDQPCIPKSWNISDDVGQIEYIFSDKTGTLTQNVMEFKKATINGQPYGEAYTEAQAGMRKRLGIDVVAESAKIRAEIAEAKVKSLAGLREIHDNPYLQNDELTFIAPDFVEDLAGKHGREQQAANEHFMLALALCHSVIAEKAPGDPHPRMVYKAQSPDEAALVTTARDVGFTVTASSGQGITVNVLGEECTYPILTLIDFTSSRKRMSAIVRMPDGRIVLFCKGADSVIYSRLTRGEQPELRKATAEHLEMFAREGLRTLCIAERVLTEEEYAGWKREYDTAATALEDREDKVEAVADTIEQELTLLGGTAIEDRLQDGVPDTIALLADAGIKLWVLTGDKVETAINIGFSCNLLNNDMELIRLKVDEDESGATPADVVMAVVEEELDKSLAALGITGSNDELRRARRDHEPPPATHALVVDGFTLRWVLDDALKQKFLLLCKRCKSVLCCRVSPAQKAAVVSMVKNGLDVMTMSVGDGANDVAMIQEADVGVGIAGEEGRQAVMSSDYAIGQFRFLQRLVLVHGRWSYRRLAETISNFFYKNIVWTFAIFWYQVFCDFDMTYIFDYTYILLFNLIFTSLPVILMGVLDQDVDDVVSLAQPQLYRRGIERLEWTQTKFWLYMLDGVYQSVMCYFIPYLTIVNAAFVTDNGLDVADRTRLGCYIAHGAVITINMYILINTYRWDWLMLLVVTISDLFIFLWTGIYTDFTYAGYFFKAAPQVYGQLTFWLVTIITPVICLFPRFAIKAIQKVYFPYDVDIVREEVRLGVYKHLSPDGVGAPAGIGSSRGSDDGVVAAESGVVSGSSELEQIKETSPRSSDASGRRRWRPGHTNGGAFGSVDEEQRPIYPPSVMTYNTRTQKGSDGTNYTMHDPPRRPSLDQDGPGGAVASGVAVTTSTTTAASGIAGTATIIVSGDDATRNDITCDPPDTPIRPSIDRARPSYDRVRASLDRVRRSYEASSDFTSAARLSMVESSYTSPAPPGQRRFMLSNVRRRGLSVISKSSLDQ